METALGVYYCWLFCVGVALYGLKQYPKQKAKLMHTVNLLGVVETTIGEMLMGSWIIALLIFNTTFWYYTFQDFWANSDVYAGVNEVPAYRQPYQVAQEFGRINEILLGLSLLPVSRNSVLDRIFGLSYVNAIRFHRITGWCLVLSICIHGLAFVIAAAYDPFQTWGSLVFNAYDAPIALSMEQSNTTYLTWGNGMFMNFLGVMGFFCMLPAAIFSCNYFRRNTYNLFYTAHFFFWAMIAFAWLHATSNFYYSLPGMGLYFLDVAVRLFHQCDGLSKVPVISAKEEVGGIIRIDLDTKFRTELENSNAEDFVRVCFPAVDPLEWHPLTLVRGSHRGVMSLYMSTSCAFPNRLDWAKDSATYLLANNGNASAGIDGPFRGHSINPVLLQDERILFLTGGSGVTPVPGLCWNAKKPHVVVWSVRLCPGEAHGAAVRFSLFADLPDYVVKIFIHETSGTGPEAGENINATPSTARVDDADNVESAELIKRGSSRMHSAQHITANQGRINFEQALLNHVIAENEPITTVFISGPKQFENDARKAVADFQKSFSGELKVVSGSFEL